MESNPRAHSFSKAGDFEAPIEADGNRILGFTAFGVGVGTHLRRPDCNDMARLPSIAARTFWLIAGWSRG
jgi:hypothetical protein